MIFVQEAEHFLLWKGSMFNFIYFGELILTVDITNMLVNSSKGYHTSYEDFHNKNKMEKRPTLLGFFHWTVDGKFVNNFMMAYFFLLELTFADQVKP